VPHDDRAVAERLAQIARHPALSSSSVAKGTPLAGDRILCSGSYRRGDVSEDGRTSASSSRTHSASSSLTKNSTPWFDGLCESAHPPARFSRVSPRTMYSTDAAWRIDLDPEGSRFIIGGTIHRGIRSDGTVGMMNVTFTLPHLTVMADEAAMNAELHEITLRGNVRIPNYDAPPPANREPTVTIKSGGMDLQQAGIVRMFGGVSYAFPDVELTADEASMNTATHAIEFRGDVHLRLTEITPPMRLLLNSPGKLHNAR
jgi:hypothetical protein